MPKAEGELFDFPFCADSIMFELRSLLTIVYYL